MRKKSARTRAASAFSLLLAAALTGCGGGGGDAAAAPPANSAPVISGSPLTSVVAGSAYSFTPIASDADGNSLSFSVLNKPAWASFSISTGGLTGTPSTAQAGTYAGVTISVSDGKTTVALPAFAIAVTTPLAAGTAAVNWTLPTLNTDGSALADLAGIRIHYGTAPDALSQLNDQANPVLTTYTLTNLTPGPWYFAVSVYTTGNVESAQTNVVSATVH